MTSTNGRKPRSSVLLNECQIFAYLIVGLTVRKQPTTLCNVRDLLGVFDVHFQLLRSLVNEQTYTFKFFKSLLQNSKSEENNTN